jgi:hypothetical protein
MLALFFLDHTQTEIQIRYCELLFLFCFGGQFLLSSGGREGAKDHV